MKRQTCALDSFPYLSHIYEAPVKSTPVILNGFVSLTRIFDNGGASHVNCLGCCQWFAGVVCLSGYLGYWLDQLLTDSISDNILLVMVCPNLLPVTLVVDSRQSFRLAWLQDCLQLQIVYSSYQGCTEVFTYGVECSVHEFKSLYLHLPALWILSNYFSVLM